MEAIDNYPYPMIDPRETGDIDQFDQTLIPLLMNSYLGQSEFLLLLFVQRWMKVEVSLEVLQFCLPGFSTDSGLALIEKRELIIVSGAPRGGYSGQVAFLKPDPKARSNLSVEFVLSGPGLASSFGYDVAVVDLNSDGYVHFRTVS